MAKLSFKKSHTNRKNRIDREKKNRITVEIIHSMTKTRLERKPDSGETRSTSRT
jgi:hypothetical protein